MKEEVGEFGVLHRCVTHWNIGGLAVNQEIGWLIRKTGLLRAEMSNLAEKQSQRLQGLSPQRAVSARNLLHYLALRRHDLREMQELLADLGLSSLGRTEGYAMSGLGAVLNLLHRLAGNSATVEEAECTRALGREFLAANTEALLGGKPPGRNVRIMVTMPGEAATDFTLVRCLLEAGMNCMRINCAHDNEAAWLGMIRNLRLARKETGLACRVQMDLAGPKLRTGAIRPAVTVLHVKPERDLYGVVTTNARIWLTPATRPEAAPEAADAVVPMPARWPNALALGRKLRLSIRGARRRPGV